MAYASNFSPDYALTLFGTKLTGFIALYGLAINFGVAAIATLALRALRTKYDLDSTVAADYA